MARGDFPQPPSSVTGELGNWLQAVWVRLANMPSVSYFSGLHPESNMTGVAGDLAINVSPSASSRIFVKYGDVLRPDRASWVSVA